MEEVYAQTAQQFHHYLECEDVGMAVVKFKNGAIGTIEGTTNVYPKNLEETLYLFGETGTVKIGGTSTNNIDVWDFADPAPGGRGPQGAAGSHQQCLRQWPSPWSTRTRWTPSPRTGRLISMRRPAAEPLEMILAMYQSAATGLPVKLPLKDVASTDFTGRFSR